MRKILLVLAALLIISSVSFAEMGKLPNESTLLVPNGRTFTIEFSSDIDTSAGNLQFVRIERDSDGSNMNVSRTASGKKLMVTLMEDLLPGYNYSVVVDPGLRGANGEIVRLKYKRSFLPNYQTSITSAKKTLTDAIESATFKVGLYEVGAKTEFQTALNTIESLKNYHVSNGDFSDNEMKLVSSIMEAVQRFNSKKYVNPQDKMFSSASITVHEEDLSFDFKYPWTGDTFDNDLEGFKVSLKRDEEYFSTLTIHKEDYSNINKMEGVVYYNNRTDFEDLLKSENIASGMYKLEIRPILKSVPQSETKVALVNFVDLTKPKMPDFEFRKDFNIIVFNEVPKPRASSEIDIAISNDGNEISFKQDDLVQVVDSDLIGKKFDPGPGKLSRVITSTELNSLFKGAVGNVTLTAHAVDKGFNDAKSAINESTINVVAYELPKITKVAGKDVDSKKDYSGLTIEKATVKNNVAMTVTTANANEGRVHLYKFKDDATENTIKNTVKKAAELRYGLNELSYSEFETAFLTDANGFNTSGGLVATISGSTASFDIEEYELGQYFVVLEYKNLWFPVEGFYLDVINGYESEMTVGYMSSGAFVEKDVFKHPTTNPDEVKIYVSLSRKADLYLLDEGQYASYNNAATDIAKKTQLDSAGGSLWKDVKRDGYVELGGTGWRENIDKKYYVVAVTEGNNFSDVDFYIADGNPPTVNVSSLMLRNVTDFNVSKYFIKYTTDKDVNLYVVKSDTVFADQNNPTAEELQDPAKHVLNFTLKKDKVEIDGELAKTDWFDNTSEFGNYVLYAVDGAGNVSAKMEDKLSDFEGARASDAGLDYDDLTLDDKLVDSLYGFVVPTISRFGTEVRKEYIGYKLSEDEPLLEKAYEYDLAEWTGATLPVGDTISHESATDKNWIIFYIFEDIGGIKKLVAFDYKALGK